MHECTGWKIRARNALSRGTSTEMRLLIKFTAFFREKSAVTPGTRIFIQRDSGFWTFYTMVFYWKSSRTGIDPHQIRSKRVRYELFLAAVKTSLIDVYANAYFLYKMWITFVVRVRGRVVYFMIFDIVDINVKRCHIKGAFGDYEGDEIV